MQWFFLGLLLLLLCGQGSALAQKDNDGTSLILRGLRPFHGKERLGQDALRRFVRCGGKLFRNFLLWDDRNSSIPDFAFFRAAVRAPPNRT